MENAEVRRRKLKKERRKDKAEKVNQATTTTATEKGGGGDGECVPPPVKKRKIKKKSTVIEDIIDGFAIRSFKTYEDLTRTVALEAGPSDALNGGSQESTTATTPAGGGGARISGSGGGSTDNNKVGSNESPSKEACGKSSTATKSPKSKKKKLSTTNQENNSNVMQPASRCSGQPGDHGNGNGSTTTASGGGPTTVPVLGEATNPSHAHSFSSQFKQQQNFCTPPTSPIVAVASTADAITIAKQQTQQQPHPKKVRVASKEKDGRKNKSEDRKEVFDSISRKDPFCTCGKASCSSCNLHHNHHHHASPTTQQQQQSRVSLTADFGTSCDIKVNNNNNRVGGTSTTNSTSTSTSTDHLLGYPTTQPLVSTSSSSAATAAVCTQFAPTQQQQSPPSAQNFQNHHHHPHHQKFPTPCRPVNSLPHKSSSTTVSANAIITSDPFGNGITIKREIPDVEVIDVKPFPASGPLSPSKRQVEVNGHNQNNNLPFPLQQTGGTYPEGASQTPFTPISQPSPKSVHGTSSLGHPAQQQVVAPVSNPKEKFGQGRIGSQTLFTPYATTAITRVRSPLGGGGPPSVSSGSQSVSATTVIQPESPKEPLVPIGSPYSSVSHLHHNHQPHNPPSSSPHHHHHPHQQHIPPSASPRLNHQHQHASLKNNQNPSPHHHHHHHHHPTVNNNRVNKTIQNNNYNNLAVVPSSYSDNAANTSHNSSVHSSGGSGSSNKTGGSTKSSSSSKPQHHHHQHTCGHHQSHVKGSGENTSVPPVGSLGQTFSDNQPKKDQTVPEQSQALNKSKSQQSQSQGSRGSSSHKVVLPHSTKDKGSTNSGTQNKSNTAFGSIARLLDSPTSSSGKSSQPNSSLVPAYPSSSGGKIPGTHHTHSHSHHHPQTSLHSTVSNSSNHHTTTHHHQQHQNYHHHPHLQHHLDQHSVAVANSHPYSGSHSNLSSSGATSITTHSLQHPGSSSSSSVGSGVSNSTTIGCPSTGTPNSGGIQQGTTVSNNHQAISLATSASTQSCSSRSHSPRGHSPTRERDSYSSNVSSLSRSSATPVSGSQSVSHLQLPPNLSPQLQSSSYSKAASWLSTVPGLSPVPRPTPPPTSLSGHPPCSIGGPLSLPPSAVSSPFGGYPPVPPHHGLASPHPATANMFAPPILPLSSISSHPASQPPAYGPGADPLYPGSTSSDIVRRDLESRLISGDRSVSGGPSSFLTRPSDLHPHHSLLPPLSGVGHLPPHNPGAPPTGPPPPHSALFPPTLFKDLPKLGMDSPFYRTNMGISYPGFNGILPPPGLTTPFAPPTQLPAYTQKKTGKWNAMHVRIAWEIYQHQQKGGSSEGAGKSGGSNSSASSTSASSSKAVPPPSSSAGLSTPPTSAASSGPSSASLTADLLRSSANHAFSGLTRPGEAPPPFTAPILSPHAPPPHASPRGTPYDPLFLNQAASHLGPPLPRYPGFGALGPSFGGLSGLGSGLLGRDLSSLVALSPGQDQWARFPARPPFPGSAPLGSNWPIQQHQQQQRPDQRDSKTPTETRRQKDSDCERPSRHSLSREGRGRDSSPFRDRSPVRPVRTPLENGDGDSRSSRSNDSHSNSTSAVHSLHSKSSGRNKEDMISSNGDRDKTPTPVLSSYDRERLAMDKSVPSLASSHPSRMYPSSSPLTTPISSVSAWDAFPGFLGAGPRMGLSLLQLSERERELARIPPPPPGSLRPGLFANGPYGALPLHLGPGGPLSGVPPGSTAMAAAAAAAAASTSKSSPVLGGSIPLLSASGAIPPSPVSLSHSHSHIHSSQQQNGPISPATGSNKAQQNTSVADEKHIAPPSAHGSSRSSKEDSR